MPKYPEAGHDDDHGVSATKYGASSDGELPGLPLHLSTADTASGSCTGETYPAPTARCKTDAKHWSSWKQEGKNMLMERLLHGASGISSAPPSLFSRGPGSPRRTPASTLPPGDEIRNKRTASMPMPSMHQQLGGPWPGSSFDFTDEDADELLDLPVHVGEPSKRFGELPEIASDVNNHENEFDSDDSSALHALSTKPVVRGVRFS
eukprot:TRINITY_DN30330_c0_g1_i1.p1 TRINITY_DN30330_c0_g1~~TRINITY_DN30330_c0_g1_i1.p1  ORF type:complete len:206 (-),score=27.17 TRINITY_DN30330_c0_g1_i1:2-619(-)